MPPCPQTHSWLAAPLPGGEQEPQAELAAPSGEAAAGQRQQQRSRPAPLQGWEKALVWWQLLSAAWLFGWASGGG